MNYFMIKTLEHTFSIPSIAGYQVRSFLQTVRNYREKFYSELTDEEFEALIRVYRHIYNSGGLMLKDSFAVRFISDEVAANILDGVKEHLFCAKKASDVYPNQSKMVFPETENAMER
jgi:hypothetical protein